MPVEKSEVYFHVGLGKVASTYLQYEVFPKLKGIYYIQRTRYRHYRQIIDQGKYEKYLLSREFDRQFEEEVKRFAQYYPDAGIIIALRRHDSWMASQYRRYVKNGGAANFSAFLDLENDKGLWKQKDVYFYPKLKLLDTLFSRPPLVLFHQSLKENPWSFIEQIASYTGTEFKKAAISTAASHTSYSERQLKFMRKMAPQLFRQDRELSSSRLVRWFQKRGQLLGSYAVLYGSNLLPERMIPSGDLIPEEKLHAVREFFAEDWERCLEYAEK